MGAVYEDVIPRMCSVCPLPALSGWLILHPVELLGYEAVARLQLVGPRGKPLGATGHCSICPRLTC